MKHLIIVASLVALLWPATAQASCSGFLDCLLGMTERTEVRAQRDVERARIEAQRDAETARIEAEAQERVRLADAEVERVKQLRFESEADRDIAIAQANAKAEEYKAMIAGLTSEKVAGIQSNADTQIAALQAQAEIATAGILETGKTERWRVAFGWATVIISLLIIGVAIIVWMRRQGGAILVLPDGRRYTPIGADARRLPWYDESIEIVEVSHAINRKS